MELFRVPFDDITSYEKGHQVSASVGLRFVAIGWWIDRYPREWTLQILLGPLHLRFTRYKFDD